jgi:hypothetical protein
MSFTWETTEPIYHYHSLIPYCQDLGIKESFPHPLKQVDSSWACMARSTIDTGVLFVVEYKMG